MEESTRFSVSLPNELLDRLERYQKNKYLPSRNAAITSLLDESLEAKGYPRKEETK